jgi:hypothetical protein
MISEYCVYSTTKNTAADSKISAMGAVNLIRQIGEQKSSHQYKE